MSAAGQTLDFSDPKLAAAYKDLTNEKTATNFMICGLTGENDAVVELLETGESGLQGLKTKLSAIHSRVIFGALAVTALDKRSTSVTSRRLKVVAYSYIPSGCSELQRANSSFQKNSAMRFFSAPHTTLDLSGQNMNDNLDEKFIGKRLQLATAAHKPTHYNFGDPSRDWSIEEIDGRQDESSSDEDFD